MSTLLTQIAKGYTKANKKLEQASLILFVLAVGLIILYYINNGFGIKTVATDNVYANFKCKLTPADQVFSYDTTALKTQTSLSLINYDSEIYSGQAGKNTVPALFAPKFTKFSEVSPCLSDSDSALVVTGKTGTKVYPEKILNYHIAVNDIFEGTQILVTYSPLSAHAQVYTRQIKGEPLNFGISGLLYKNSDVFFDTKTETLWSSLNGKAIVGTMLGATLSSFPFTKMDMKTINAKYPNAEYLSFDTGTVRDYNTDPFSSYKTEDKTYLQKPINFTDQLNFKTKILGFRDNAKPYAIALPDQDSLGNSTWAAPYTYGQTDNVNFAIKANGTNYKVYNNKNKEVESTQMYWYIWFDLYPAAQLLEKIR